MTIVLSVNAQSDDLYHTKEITNNPIENTSAENNGWSIISHDADELTEQEAYNSIVYTTDAGSVVLWNNDNKRFRIISNDIFDSKVDRNGWSLDYKNLFVAIIGYYDINNKLIEKKKCGFEIGANSHQAHSIKYGMHRQEGKYVISYLRNKKGYVRIIASLYGSNGKFDIKVPCMNN
jgi:hypothetical protein